MVMVLVMVMAMVMVMVMALVMVMVMVVVRLLVVVIGVMQHLGPYRGPKCCIRDKRKTVLVTGDDDVCLDCQVILKCLFLHAILVGLKN